MRYHHKSGADFHSFTYAKYGRAVLEQPGQFSWQVFEAKVLHLLRPEYDIARVTKVRAQTLEELAAKLEDVNAEGFLRTVRAFNAAVRGDVPFDPYSRPSRRTRPPAGSPSPSAVCAWTGTRRCSITTRPRSRGPTPPARWSAGSSTSTTRAAPASSRAPSSAAWPAPRPRAAGADYALTFLWIEVHP